MTEPTIQVTQQDILAILGSKEVEIQMLRMQLAAANAKIAELTPKQPE